MRLPKFPCKITLHNKDEPISREKGDAKKR